eukprot:4597228-Pyramimonas_sp.AAC.1
MAACGRAHHGEAQRVGRVQQQWERGVEEGGALGVLAPEELHGGLPEVGDLRQQCLPRDPRLLRFHVHLGLVRGVEEDIVRLHRRRARLLAPEHQVHPPVQVRAHVLALQRLAVHAHELVHATFRPGGEQHVPHCDAVLLDAELVAVHVEEELREVEELGRELLDVLHVLQAVLPAVGHGVEEAVRVVELAALQRAVQRGERLQPDQVAEDDGGGGVVRPVQEGGRVRVVLHRELVPLLEVVQPGLGQRADGLGQVPEGGRVVEVELGGSVVGENPGEDRVLAGVVVGAAGERVEEHQVVEGGALPPPPPLLRALRRLELLLAGVHHRRRGRRRQLHAHLLHGGLVREVQQRRGP